ncbi:VOC family protein [Parerythrobacter aestuarii]|uniref:VOC family protein n=1 Tax=Parerythrobacter aestuarii TaxID=3020909 RepID=UPI0024DE5654|nr:VOC family protein [Parerythrobacter aestuarii]
MPKGYLEHANVTVSDPQRSSALMQALCGWKERWSGPSRLGGQTIHVGDEAHYIAFYTAGPVARRYSKGQPLNHLAVVVDDLDTAEQAVRDAGLEPGERDVYEPGQRFYFFDWDGIEFEVVSYE